MLFILMGLSLFAGKAHRCLCPSVRRNFFCNVVLRVSWHGMRNSM